jgi:hypothetical protein
VGGGAENFYLNQKYEMIKLKIMKYEMIYKQKKYKFTAAFLALLKRVYYYMHVIEFFKNMRFDAVKKFFELLKFYNSYCIQLIIGIGATQFQIKKITSKNLAISALALQFLIEVLDSIKSKILNSLVSQN